MPNVPPGCRTRNKPDDGGAHADTPVFSRDESAWQVLAAWYVE
jgi:hypothetical protein